MAMLTDRVLAAGSDAPVAGVVEFAPFGRSLLALWLTRKIHAASSTSAVSRRAGAWAEMTGGSDVALEAMKREDDLRGTRMRWIHFS